MTIKPIIKSILDLDRYKLTMGQFIFFFYPKQRVRYSFTCRTKDEEVKQSLIDLMSSPYELSPNWFDKHEIVVKDANRTYKTDVISVMQRFRYYKMMEAIKILDDKGLFEQYDYHFLQVNPKIEDAEFTKTYKDYKF